VIAFNHYSMSHSRQQNVDWFLEQIPAGVTLNLDMITHSRGGLVARQLTEALVSRGHKVGKVVFGATPNRGTPLANADHTTDLVNRYTSIMRFLPSSLATEALEGVFMLVKAVAHGAFKALPGLAAMHPDSELIRQLNSPGDISPETTYYAIAANFEPDRSKNEFGSFFKRMTTDQLMDSVFNEAEHDLVVPYRGVYEYNGDPKFPIPEDRILRYERNAGVHHCSIFPPMPTGNILLDWLKAPEEVNAAAKPVSPAKSSRLVALVIGNGQYSNRPLKNPANDALAVSKMFDEMGYEVVRRTDCNRLEFIDTLIEFSNRLQGVEVAAFFFAGHGIQFNGENYLLPIDARMDMERHVAAEGLALS